MIAGAAAAGLPLQAEAAVVLGLRRRTGHARRHQPRVLGAQAGRDWDARRRQPGRVGAGAVVLVHPRVPAEPRDVLVDAAAAAGDAAVGAGAGVVRAVVPGGDGDDDERGGAPPPDRQKFRAGSVRVEMRGRTGGGLEGNMGSSRTASGRRRARPTSSRSRPPAPPPPGRTGSAPCGQSGSRGPGTGSTCGIHRPAAVRSFGAGSVCRDTGGMGEGCREIWGLWQPWWSGRQLMAVYRSPM